MLDSAKTVLVVSAHPDDEALGFGGTAHRLTANGVRVHSAILVGDAEVRGNRPETEQLVADAEKAHELLGMEPPILGHFPNIQLNTVPHLDLVQFIENAIRRVEPDVIVAVHPGDINNDHHQVSLACQAAARLPQRQPEVRPISALLFMEVLSSTEWSIASGPQFRPTVFFEIGRAGLEAKLQALDAYRGVMRHYPHPRSREAVSALATVRGSESGLVLAESFEVGFARLGIENV
jgi:LmbE family N-acetylglucosaminyl deacetylase